MKKLQITLLSLLGIATACSNNIDDAITDTTGKAVIVQASIGEAKVDRAAIGGTDGLSYTEFESSDEISLFAQGGLKADNTKLTYKENKTFASEDLNWLGGQATGVWAYYPYSTDQDSNTAGTQINIWRTTPINGFDDILTAKLSDNVAEGTTLHMAFSHHFALLVIKRGDGFDDGGLTDPQKEVTVSLNEAIAETATIKSGVAIEFQSGDKQGLATKKDSQGDYYVIIPVGKLGNTSIGIASIKIYNQLGKETIVPYSKTFASGKKYTVTVKMRNNTAVVSPTEIVQWDNENVAIEEPAGITQANFIDWVGAYNDQGTDASNAILNQCGKYDEAQKQWIFSLKEDIDIATLPTGSGFHGITNFNDIFDGQGHTISNIKIEEMDVSGSALPTGFVRTLAATGEIKRLLLKDAVVYGTDNVGAFVGKAESGAKVSNCKLIGASIVYGTVQGNVDAFVGGGHANVTITNCTSTPTVIVKVGTN